MERLYTKSLPDLWSLAEKFSNDHPNLKFCTEYLNFYFYSDNIKIWKSINNKELTSIFLVWLKINYVIQYKQFQPRRVEDIIILLQAFNKFSMVKSKAEANKDGFLLPFINGVLNTKTLDFLKHEPSHYSTHLVNVVYNKEDIIENTPMAQFLASICNFDPLRLNILRACLYILFTNNIKYQIALYIHGSGGTGKSTLINMLLYLIGSEASLSTTLTSLNSRFGLSSLLNKIFLVINDMDHYKGSEPKKFKEIVTGDKMESEKKYKDSFVFSPRVFVTLTSNSLWEIKNKTSGLNRRVLYFPFDFIPTHKILDLFNVTPLGLAEGKLVPLLPGFVNWILSCNKEYINGLNAGGEFLSSAINHDNLTFINPLKAWIEEWLDNNKDSQTSIGNSTTKKNTLYGNYYIWAKINNVEPIKNNRFSELLIDSLKVLKWNNITKKRTASGLVITGITIKTKSELMISSNNLLYPLETKNLDFLIK